MRGLSDECRYDFAQWICGGVHGEEFPSACDSCWRVAEYVESEFLSRLLTEAEERGAAKVRERVEAVAVRFDALSDSTINADDRVLYAAVAVEIRSASIEARP